MKHPLCTLDTAIATMVAAAGGKFKIGCSQVAEGHAQMPVNQQAVDSGPYKFDTY